MVRILKIYRILLSAILALLGFSCGKFVEHGAEYGMPSATYKAKGAVVSEEDDTPIEGIRAELKIDDTRYGTLDTTHTNSEGFFFLEGSDFPTKILYVELTDVANGSFAKMTVEADYTNATFTGGSGNWYRGTAEIDLGTIKMKPEEPDEPE